MHPGFDQLQGMLSAMFFLGGPLKNMGLTCGGGLLAWIQGK